MISIQIRMVAFQDKKSELQQFVQDIVKDIKEEEGCVKCEILRDTKENQVFIIHELWASRRAATKHLDSYNLAALSGAKAVLLLDLQILSSTMKSEPFLQKRFNERFGKIM